MPAHETWPTWEVGLYGFGDVYVEAPTAKSARWWAATKCHKAGYGESPVELIQRGVDIRQVTHSTAAIFGNIYRVEPKRALSHSEAS
jgi:hypothetical protein